MPALAGGSNPLGPRPPCGFRAGCTLTMKQLGADETKMLSTFDTLRQPTRLQGLHEDRLQLLEQSFSKASAPVSGMCTPALSAYRDGRSTAGSRPGSTRGLDSRLGSRLGSRRASAPGSAFSAAPPLTASSAGTGYRIPTA